MLNSKLIDIFSVLDKKEIKMLSKFVYSPVFNQHKGVTQLFEYIVSLEKFSEANLEKRKVYSNIFPKSKFDDLKLRHVVSYLLRVCEDCLAFIESNKNERFYRLNLLRAYQKKNLEKHFFNDLLLHKRGLRVSAKKSVGHYLSEALINAAAFDTSTLNDKPELEFLKESETELNLYFILSKLKNRTKLQLHAPNSETENLLFWAEIELIIEKKGLLAYPEIETYFWACKTVENPGLNGHYKMFKEKLALHGLKFEIGELRELFTIAITHCKNMLAEHRVEYERELFEIYLYGLASEALLNNQKLSFSSQKNIVDIGLKLGEVKWVEEFIVDSKHITEKKLRDELFQLNQAKVHFYKQNFKVCIAVLSEEKIRHPQLLTEALQIKIKCLQNLREYSEVKKETQKLKEITKNLKM